MRHLFPLLLIFLAPLSMGQTLTDENAGNFIDSLDPVTRYANTLGSEVQEGLLANEIVPQAGEPLEPYTRSLAYIREDHPEVYEAMGDIVADHGFSDLEEWASTGDKVMVAFLALQMEGNEIEPMTPEMLAQVPAQMRPQIERMLAMMEAVRNAPQEDIEIIRPLAGRLQEYMNNAAGA